MYLFKDEINYTGFFFMSKRLVESGQWAGVPQATRSILPVIMKHANSNGMAFPGHQTIGVLAGLSEKSVSNGVKYISSLEGFKVVSYKTPKGNKAYKYYTPKYKGEGLIRINESLFESGVWRELSHTAKSVYIVLRVLAVCDHWDYMVDEEERIDSDKDQYRTRKYDLVRFENYQQIAKLAGVSRHSLNTAIKSLKDNALIADHPEGEEEQVIYIEPKDKTYYKREFLNGKIRQAYTHKLKRL